LTKFNGRVLWKIATLGGKILRLRQKPPDWGFIVYQNLQKSLEFSTIKSMLTSKAKKKVIEKHQIHDKDTGSPEVQIAVLTEQIKKLVNHLKKNPKDNLSRRGLLKMVSKRRTLLNYLQKESEKRYESLTKKVGLKAKKK